MNHVFVGGCYTILPCRVPPTPFLDNIEARNIIKTFNYLVYEFDFISLLDPSWRCTVIYLGNYFCQDFCPYVESCRMQPPKTKIRVIMMDKSWSRRLVGFF